jgi:hypothetical protein
MKNIRSFTDWLFNRRRRWERRYENPPSAYTPLTREIDLPPDLPDWIHEHIPEPAVSNPHRNYRNMYKGQIHVHTNYPSSVWWGDGGQQTPEQVVRAYKDKGYAFISLTAHNLLVPTPDNLDVEDIVCIPGVESGKSCRHHLVGVGISTEGFDRGRVKDTCYCDEIQPRINYLRMDRNGIVVVAHPGPDLGHDGWWPHLWCDREWSQTDVRTCYGYHGIEVFNANRKAIHLWDRLLCDGKRVWGFGADDCHNVSCDNLFNFNRSWIVVNSDKEKTDVDFGQDILNNIKTGNFYTVLRSSDITGRQDTPSSGSEDIGPELRIVIWGNEIRVHTDQKSLVNLVYYYRPSNLVWQALGFALPSNDHTATFTLEGTEGWARVEIVQKRNGEYYRALSQPLFPPFVVD